MMIIFIEIFISTIILYLMGEKVFHFFHFTKKDFLRTLLYSVLYFLVMYSLKDTYFGQEALGTFTKHISAPVVLLLTLYPIVIAFSEELFFRLYLSEKTNMLGSSFLFTVMHWRPNSSPTLMMFCVLCIFAMAQWSLFQTSKSLWSVVITHLIVTYSLIFMYMSI